MRGEEGWKWRKSLPGETFQASPPGHPGIPQYSRVMRVLKEEEQERAKNTLNSTQRPALLAKTNTEIRQQTFPPGAKTGENNREENNPVGGPCGFATGVSPLQTKRFSAGPAVQGGIRVAYNIRDPFPRTRNAYGYRVTTSGFHRTRNAYYGVLPSRKSLPLEGGVVWFGGVGRWAGKKTRTPTVTLKFNMEESH